MPPSEFWGMTPSEVWLIIDAKLPEKKYGNLTATEYEKLVAKRAELEAQGVALA